MKQLTIEELQEQIDEIIDQYDKGSDQHFEIVWEDDNGTEKKAYLTPYNGPYEQKVQVDDNGEYFVEIPPRLLAKQGWDENTNLNMEVVDGAIHLTEVKK